MVMTIIDDIGHFSLPKGCADAGHGHRTDRAGIGTITCDQKIQSDAVKSFVGATTRMQNESRWPSRPGAGSDPRYRLDRSAGVRRSDLVAALPTTHRWPPMSAQPSIDWTATAAKSGFRHIFANATKTGELLSQKMPLAFGVRHRDPAHRGGALVSQRRLVQSERQMGAAYRRGSEEPAGRAPRNGDDGFGHPRICIDQ